jgi:uncharacterized surface protein with fasciclin (FAS1) repeats
VGLDEALGGDDTFTVFSPTNDAFDNLPPGTVDALLDDIPAVTNVLLFHAHLSVNIISSLTNDKTHRF